MWHWITQTNAGLAARIGVGAAIFAVLALVDLKRNGARATRWREYAFLVGCVVLAMIYGVVNDLITSTISWEYFYYGKELWRVFPPQLPPKAGDLYPAACVIGMKATWTAGLLIGAILLIANNPRRNRPPLKYRVLFRMLGMIATIAIGLGILLGAVGYHGGLTWLDDDFARMVREDDMRPYRFMATWGVHLGGYIGGLLGLITSVLTITAFRRRIASAPQTSSATL